MPLVEAFGLVTLTCFFKYFQGIKAQHEPKKKKKKNRFHSCLESGSTVPDGFYTGLNTTGSKLLKFLSQKEYR